jgi:CheY-like chemotaxis protein
MLSEQEHWLEPFARLLSFVLIGSLVIFLLVNYGLTFRRILQGIASLQAGFRIIGPRALDYGISIRNKDEIGELFHAFNRMTANLEKEMASKDVILLDLNLPDSAGMETLQSLNGMFPQLPIAVLTGLNDAELTMQSVQLLLV